MNFHLVYSLLLLQFVLGYAPFENKSPDLQGKLWCSTDTRGGSDQTQLEVTHVTVKKHTNTYYCGT